jgi:hypothetical protein
MSELQVIDVDLMPGFPRSLAEIFSDCIATNFANPEDPEDIRAEHVHFRVHAYGFPYHAIVDFMERLPAIEEAAKIGKIELIYDFPEVPRESVLNYEIKQVLKAFEEKQHSTEADGPILSNGSVIDLIMQLHTSVLARDAEIQSLRNRLLIADPTVKFEDGHLPKEKSLLATYVETNLARRLAAKANKSTARS